MFFAFHVHSFLLSSPHSTTASIGTRRDVLALRPRQTRRDMLLLSEIEVFDGSQLIDTVVISNVFWTTLKAKALSVIIGQFIAIIVFGILSSVAATQIQRLTTSLTKNVFESSTNNEPRKFVTADKMRKEADFGKLLVCLAIDIIGTSSELVPFLGELSDVIWAPVAALLLRSLYGGSNVIFVLEFAEEILPFTDVLPLATVCWVVDTYFYESNLAQLLQVGVYGRQQDHSSSGDGKQSDVIDVESFKLPSRDLVDQDDKRR
jgi:hypothetical protein